METVLVSHLLRLILPSLLRGKLRLVDALTTRPLLLLFDPPLLSGLR